MTGRRLVTNTETPLIAVPQTGFRGLSARARLLLGVLVLGVLAAGLYLVPTYAAYGLAFLGLGVPLLLLLWSRPEFGLLALLFLTSSFVPANIVDLRLPIGGGLELRDLALLGMLGLLLFQALIRKRLTKLWWPVGVPLLALSGLGLFSAFYAIVYQGVASNWALRDLRAIVFYAVFFVACWADLQRRQLKIVLTGLFVIADLTTGIVIIQQFLGASQRLLAAMLDTDWQLWQQSAASGGFGLVRIVPPGHVLMYFMMVVAFGLLLFGRNTWRQRAVLVFQSSFLSLGLLFTYTRAQWIATAAAMAIVFVMAVPAHKARFARYLILGVSVLLLLFSVWGSEMQGMLTNMPVFNALTSRVFSLFTPSETLESTSLEWRLYETEEALRSIAEHPLLGVGLGGIYRDLTLLRGEAAGRMLNSLDPDALTRYTRFLHNSYLSIGVKMGLLALLCFLWLCAACLIRGWKLYRNLSDDCLKGIVAATLTSFAGLLLWSVLHPHFIEVESTPVIGLMFGLVACAQALHTRAVGPCTCPEHAPAHVPDSESAQ